MVLTPKWTTCPDALRKSQTVTVSLSKFAKESVDYGTHHSSTLERWLECIECIIQINEQVFAYFEIFFVFWRHTLCMDDGQYFYLKSQFFWSDVLVGIVWNLSMNIYIFSVFFCKSPFVMAIGICAMFLYWFFSLWWTTQINWEDICFFFWFKSVLKLQEWRFGALCLFAYMNPHWGFPNASNLLFD